MNEAQTWKKELVLLQEIAGGDEKAFERLYQSTVRKTYFYLIRILGGKDAAEDVLAETYTQVWKNAKSFRGESSAGTWIIGIARNLTKKALQKSKKTQGLNEIREVADENPGSLENLNRLKILNKAILKLSPDHREVVDLVFFCQMTYPEVAKIVGIPVNTVKTRVFYAKERLKAILDAMGITKNDI